VTKSRLVFVLALVLASLTVQVSTGWAGCGDPTQDDKVTAADALVVLRGSVGLPGCLPSACDIDGSGTVTASDALGVLRLAVGEDVLVNCPVTTSTVTNSTGDQCFHNSDCGDASGFPGEPYCCGYHCCECDSNDTQCQTGFICVAEHCVPN
jgi:hypothetical protein